MVEHVLSLATLTAPSLLGLLLSLPGLIFPTTMRVCGGEEGDDRSVREVWVCEAR